MLGPSRTAGILPAPAAGRAALLAAAIGLLGWTAAAQDLHVSVTAKAEVVFDGDGRVSAVRHVWQFDEAFSAAAVEGLDADGDGATSTEELAPLAKVNVEALHEYGFFTWLTIDGADPAFLPPTEYWADIYEGRLTLFLTLPLAEPVAVRGSATLLVADPENHVGFDFAPADPVALVGAPAGCAAAYHPPQQADEDTMRRLAEAAAEGRELPPDLDAAATALIGYASIDCP